MKSAFLLSVLVILMATPARGQRPYPRIEIGGGYSPQVVDRARRNMPKGWTGSAAVNLHRNFGLEASVTGHYEHYPLPPLDVSYYLYQGGPRVTFRSQRLTPWAHALFGVSQCRISGAGTIKTSFAGSFGGGLDVNVHRRVALRVVQADYVRMRISDLSAGGTTGGGFGLILVPTPANSLAFSFGVVIKLGGL